MKKTFFLAVIALSFQVAYAAELDGLKVEEIGEGSVISFDKDVIIPAKQGYAYSAVTSPNAIHLNRYSDTNKYVSGSAYAGCEVTMVEESNKVRKIKAATHLVIKSVEEKDKNYTMKFEGGAIESLQCRSGVVSPDDKSDKMVPASDAFEHDDSSSEFEEYMTVAEFNVRMKGIFSLTPAEAEEVSVDNSERDSAGEAGDQDSAPVSTASPQ